MKKDETINLEKRCKELEEDNKDLLYQHNKDTELIRLKDNHIRNLESIINSLKLQLSLHTGPFYKRVGRFFKRFGIRVKHYLGRKMPEGSKRRNIFIVCMGLFAHPLRFFHSIGLGGSADIKAQFIRLGKIKFETVEKPMVSIIIPVYNQINYTYRCLDSINKYSNDVIYEVIIADDHSTDGTKYIKRYVQNIVVNENNGQKGFLMNCKNAAKLAKGKYILFLNNDTLVTKDWLSSLTQLTEADNTIGMIGSKFIYPNGVLSEAGGIIYSDGSGCNYGRNDNASKSQYNYVRDVDYISGASIMISKKLWNEIGGFDERFSPAYCEDSDLAFEVRKRGYRVVYQPKSVVIHFEGVSNGTDVNNQSGLKHYQVENTEKFKEKWKKELKNLPSRDLNPMDFTYRDRLLGRKMILVMDHHVPEWDKDAGSRSTYNYLKMFIDKGYFVKFMGDNFTKMEPYTSELQQLGIEVLYGEGYSEKILEWIKTNKNNIDFIYANRPLVIIKYLDYIKNHTEIPINFFGHDLHFLREEREYELTKDVSHKEESEHMKYVEFKIMKQVNVSYYPSYIEEDMIKKIDPSIHVKTINAYMFDKKCENVNKDFENREGLLFVGGFSHHPNVDAALWFVKEIYPLISKDGSIPLYIVGSNAPEEIKALDGNGVIVKGFLSDEELAKLYNSCRLSVVPLRYGAGIKGKIIESIYHGLPVVTTDVGIEGIAHSEDIITVENDAKKFAEATVKLYHDPKKLKKLSDDSEKFIQKYYSEEAAWNIVKEDFQKK